MLQVGAHTHDDDEVLSKVPVSDVLIVDTDKEKPVPLEISVRSLLQYSGATMQQLVPSCPTTIRVTRIQCCNWSSRVHCDRHTFNVSFYATVNSPTQVDTVQTVQETSLRTLASSP